MRNHGSPICSHCEAIKSPLWRRGSNQEVLCNACGLYWKHHGENRPLSLKFASDRKSNSKINSFEIERARESRHRPKYHDDFYSLTNNRSVYRDFNSSSSSDLVTAVSF